MGAAMFQRGSEREARTSLTILEREMQCAESRQLQIAQWGNSEITGAPVSALAAAAVGKPGCDLAAS
jgi:hypothetical protein